MLYVLRWLFRQGQLWALFAYIWHLLMCATGGTIASWLFLLFMSDGPALLKLRLGGALIVRCAIVYIIGFIISDAPIQTGGLLDIGLFLVFGALIDAMVRSWREDYRDKFHDYDEPLLGEPAA